MTPLWWSKIVKRHLHEGLDPKAAARKAMDEVSGPVIAVAVVLTAVFLPSAFLPGISGQFYRQFAVTVAISTIISAFNSLTLSPALCGILLCKRELQTDLVTRTIDFVGGWFFGAVNRAFNWTACSYANLVRRILRLVAVALILYLGLLVLTYFGFKLVPTGFIPTQDQGYLVIAAQLHDAASLQRTDAVRIKIEQALRDVPGIAHIIAINGFSVLTGSNQSNACTLFVLLKPLHNRTSRAEGLNGMLAAINQKTASIQEATVTAFPPPPVQGIGATGGFQLEIEDRGNLGLGELQAVSNQLMGAAYQEPGLTQVYTPLRTNVPQLYVNIDRTKALRLGIPISNVFDALQTYLGAN